MRWDMLRIWSGCGSSIGKIMTGVKNEIENLTERMVMFYGKRI